MVAHHIVLHHPIAQPCPSLNYALTLTRFTMSFAGFVAGLPREPGSDRPDLRSQEHCCSRSVGLSCAHMSKPVRCKAMQSAASCTSACTATQPYCLSR